MPWGRLRGGVAKGKSDLTAWAPLREGAVGFGFVSKGLSIAIYILRHPTFSFTAVPEAYTGDV